MSEWLIDVKPHPDEGCRCLFLIPPDVAQTQRAFAHTFRDSGIPADREAAIETVIATALTEYPTAPHDTLRAFLRERVYHHQP